MTREDLISTAVDATVDSLSRQSMREGLRQAAYEGAKEQTLPRRERRKLARERAASEWRKIRDAIAH